MCPVIYPNIPWPRPHVSNHILECKAVGSFKLLKNGRVDVIFASEMTAHCTEIAVVESNQVKTKSKHLKYFNFV